MALAMPIRLTLYLFRAGFSPHGRQSNRIVMEALASV